MPQPPLDTSLLEGLSKPKRSLKVAPLDTNLLQSGVEGANVPEPMTEAPTERGLDPDTLARRVGTLAFERRQPLTVPQPTGPDIRMLFEGGLSAGGELLGARFGGTPGAIAGAGVGGAVGSLAAQPFDPVARPVPQAIESGLTAAALTGAVHGGLGIARRAIGRPTEASQLLLNAAERAGKIPPAGALFPDSAMLANIQSVAQADILFGARVTRMLKDSKDRMTTELRDHLDSYLRTKALADEAYKTSDTMIERTVGKRGIVKINEQLLRAAEPLIDAWERLGLDSKLKIDLVGKLKAAQAARDRGAVVLPNLSLQEADALQSRLWRAAIDMRRGTTSGKQALGGVEFADAYQGFARDATTAIDEAIEKQIKTGVMTVADKAKMVGARTLWKQWKTGEAIRDELMVELSAAAREGGPVTSGAVFAAITRLEKLATRTRKGISPKGLITQEQVDRLTTIGRAIQQAEKSETQKAFTWTVRAGQLGILTGGASIMGGTPLMFITVTPVVLNWLTTSKPAVRWMLAGLKAEPGTTAALTATRQLLTAAVREGVIPPDRIRQDGFEIKLVPDISIGRDPFEAVKLQPEVRFPAPRPAPLRNPSLPSVNPTFVPNFQPATILPERAGAPRG